MMNEAKMTEPLGRGYGILRADLCCNSRLRAIVEEKKEICNYYDGDEQGGARCHARGLEQMPPVFRSKPDMLRQSWSESPRWDVPVATEIRCTASLSR